MITLDPRFRLFAAATSLCLGLSFAAPPPAGAGDLQAQKTHRPQSLSSAAAAKVAKADARQAVRFAQAPTADSTSGSSRGFFSSPKGIAVLVLMVGGTGYAVYSAKHDRINNPLR